jgi:hypothetical protein
MGTRVQYRPSSAVPGGISSATYSRTHATSARDSPHKDAAAAVSSAPAIIEQSKRDAAGGVYTKRFLKGAILGKGGFAKCYRVTDMDTKEEWACKIIEKKSLTKQRHKTKVTAHSMQVPGVVCQNAPERSSSFVIEPKFPPPAIKIRPWGCMLGPKKLHRVSSSKLRSRFIARSRTATS